MALILFKKPQKIKEEIAFAKLPSDMHTSSANVSRQPVPALGLHGTFPDFFWLVPRDSSQT